MIMSVEEILTEITMTYSKDVHIIVEGESDRKFFFSVIKGNNLATIYPAYGAENVIELMDKIHVENQTALKPIMAFGVIDLDYRIPLNKLPNNPNIFISDYRDLEVMMFSSPALGNVLSELGSHKKISNFGGENAIRTHTLNIGKKVGEVRYLSQSTGRNISFKYLNYEKFLDESLNYLTEQFINHINGSQVDTIEKVKPSCLNLATQVTQAALDGRGSRYFTNDFFICRGHDLLTILSIGLKKLWGTKKTSEVSREILESYFRVSYIEYFKTTVLYTSIKNWLVEKNLYNRVMI